MCPTCIDIDAAEDRTGINRYIFFFPIENPPHFIEILLHIKSFSKNLVLNAHAQPSYHLSKMADHRAETSDYDALDWKSVSLTHVEYPKGIYNNQINYLAQPLFAPLIISPQNTGILDLESV